MKIDHDAVLKRIQADMKRRFPVGCLVKMTPEAAAQWPKYAGVLGTVVRHAHGGVSPSVQWEGRKTDSSYHPDFLRRVVRR